MGCIIDKGGVLKRFYALDEGGKKDVSRVSVEAVADFLTSECMTVIYAGHHLFLGYSRYR